MTEDKNTLALELGELFDMRKAKIRDEKRQVQEASEAQKDIRLISLMFRDGVPDMTIQVSETESIRWNAHTQMLLYQSEKGVQILEGAKSEITIKMRPFLGMLVKKAKEFFVHN